MRKAAVQRMQIERTAVMRCASDVMTFFDFQREWRENFWICKKKKITQKGTKPRGKKANE